MASVCGVMIRHWLTLLYVWCVMIVTISGYYNWGETECPTNIDPEIFLPPEWLPPVAHLRAWRTLPWKIFTIKDSSIPGAGVGVFANTFISRHTWLAPYEGEIVSTRWVKKYSSYNYTYAWRVYTSGKVTHYIDAMDDSLSNWLRFVNCPRHVTEENVISHTCYGHIMYMTTKDVAPGQELFIYYGDSYAKNHLGINVTKYKELEFADLLTGKISNTTKES